MKNAGQPLFLPNIILSGVFLAGAIAAVSLTPIFSGSVRAQVAPAVDAPDEPAVAGPAVDVPIANPSPTSWLTYKADLQRTGATNARLGAAPNLLWRHSTDVAGRSYDTSPLIVGPPGQRRIYISVDNTLFCIDGQTGAQIWRSEPLSRPVVSPIILLPGEAGDLILAVTSSGQLNALRTSDGAQAWQIGAAAPVQNVAPVIIKTADGERIMIALATGRLIAFTLNGRLDPAWEVRLGSFASSPTATPSVSADERFLYIPSQDKKLFAVDIAAARVAFPVTLRTGANTSPVLFEDRIFLVTGTTLSSMTQRTGQPNWVFDVKSALGAPAASRSAEGGAIFVGARNGKFYALNSSSGAKLWETDLDDSVTGAPTVTADMVLVGTRNGILFGLSPDDGRVLWRYRLQTERVVAPRESDNDSRNQDGGFDTTIVQPRQAGGSGTGRGGFVNAEAGKPATDAPIWDTATTQTFGVTAPPVVVDGRVYMLANNAALYAFGTQPFDANPPQVSNARLSILNNASRRSLQRLDSEKPLLIPGQAPVELTAEISDVGSGVDPTSIVVKLNNQALPQTAIGKFSDATGKLQVTLAERKGRVAVNLDDGLYTVAITARDYRGNEMNYSVNFLVDKTVSPPAAPVDEGNDDNYRRN